MSVLTIHKCEQGTDEWYRLRMGIPTASEFATVMASGKSGGESVTRRKYMYQLAGELLTGRIAENYTNAHMERGRAMEDSVRTLYLDKHPPPNFEFQRVGFIRNGSKGCSPDCLIGTDGMLEVKTELPKLLVATHAAGDFPAEHKAQCQGALWVAEREWIDIAIGWTDVEPGFPGIPLFVHRTYRDETYIGRLSREIDRFNEQLSGVVEFMRKQGEDS